MKSVLLLLVLVPSSVHADPLWCGTFAPSPAPSVTRPEPPVRAAVPAVVVTLEDRRDSRARAVIEQGLRDCAGRVEIIVGPTGVPLTVRGDNPCLTDGARTLRFAATGDVRAIRATIAKHPMR